MIHLLHKKVTSTINTLFPRYCVSCGKADESLCVNCQKEIVALQYQSCIRCGRITPEGKTCSGCQPTTQVAQTVAAAGYHDGPLKEALHALKYGGRRDIGASLISITLGLSTIQQFLQNLDPTTIIIPVPLHFRRLWWRGFNQSQIIAQGLAEKTSLTYIPHALVRHRATSIQANLTRSARKANVSDAFYVRNPALLKGKKVLVIDDIITTGATASACAHVLRAAGARQVYALAIARG